MNLTLQRIQTDACVSKHLRFLRVISGLASINSAHDGPLLQTHCPRFALNPPVAVFTPIESIAYVDGQRINNPLVAIEAYVARQLNLARRPSLANAMILIWRSSPCVLRGAP